MSTIYFTITGVNHYYGNDFVQPGMKVRLTKEPDNEYDREAIKTEVDGLGKIGYVANNPYTVIGESFSACRLYDRIADTATGEALYKLPGAILCRLHKKSIIYTPPVIAKQE